MREWLRLLLLRMFCSHPDLEIFHDGERMRGWCADCQTATPGFEVPPEGAEWREGAV